MAEKKAPPSRSGSSAPPNLSQTPATPPCVLPPIPGLTDRPAAEMTLAELEAAIAAFPAKIGALRQSYGRLVAISPIPFPFRWEAMDAYLCSLHAEMSRKLLAAQASSHVDRPVETAEGAKEESEQAPPSQDAADVPSEEIKVGAKKASSEPDGKVLEEERRRGREPVPRKRLVKACERMMFFKLLGFVRNSGRDIRAEFLPALRRAPNGPVLVLTAVRELVPTAPRDERIWENCTALIRCVPALTETKELHEVTVEQAMIAAKRWIDIIAKDEEPKVLGRGATWALLHFLAAYGIGYAMEDEEIMKLFDAVRDKKGSVDLLKSLGLADRATGICEWLAHNCSWSRLANLLHCLQLHCVCW